MATMPAASQPSFWQRARINSKAGFDKIYAVVDKLGPPVNRLSNKLGSEAFWPTTLDKESDKAARILKSFCKDGFYQEETKRPEDGPNAKAKQRVLKRIPQEVIRNAKGLAIFTTMRTGLWVSGAGGSGVLVARLPDGSWSPPSGIMLHTAGLGFLVGVDIYDCVVVINTEEALQAFSKVRCTLGGEVSAVAGPLGVGGVLESEVHKRQAPIFTYLKSRGFYAGVQIDGTIIIERTDENERFYGERISVGDIMAGKVRHPPYELKTLMATLKAAQGDEVDEALLPTEAPPADFEIADSESNFGTPDPEDDDPYGVRALSVAGFEIKEAGTQRTPDSGVFEFNPAPTSPAWRSSISMRRSIDARSVGVASPRNSWRVSSQSESRKSSMVETSTQTDFDDVAPMSPRLAHAPARSPTSATFGHSQSMEDIPENKSIDDIVTTPLETPANPLERSLTREDATSVYGDDSKNEVDPVDVPLPRANSIDYEELSRKYSEELQRDLDAIILDEEKPEVKSTVAEPTTTPATTEPIATTSTDPTEPPDDEHEDYDDDLDHAIIHEVHSAQTIQPIQVHSPTAAAKLISRARLVEVPKRGPPPQLPPRNPIRNRGKPLIIGSEDSGSPRSSTHVRRTSGGSSPTSALTRHPSDSSLDSVEMNRRLVDGWGRRAEMMDVSLSDDEKVEKMSPAVVRMDEKMQEEDWPLPSAGISPAISPSPAVPGAFP